MKTPDYYMESRGIRVDTEESVPRQSSMLQESMDLQAAEAETEAESDRVGKSTGNQAYVYLTIAALYSVLFVFRDLPVLILFGQALTHSAGSTYVVGPIKVNTTTSVTPVSTIPVPAAAIEPDTVYHDVKNQLRQDVQASVLLGKGIVIVEPVKYLSIVDGVVYGRVNVKGANGSGEVTFNGTTITNPAGLMSVKFDMLNLTFGGRQYNLKPLSPLGR